MIDDHELLRRLVDADAQCPPPAPLRPVRAGHLATRLRRQRISALVASAAIVLLGVALTMSWPRRQRADDETARHRLESELRQLLASTEHLLAELRAPAVPDRGSHRDDGPRRLRYELAAARAAAIERPPLPIEENR